MQDAGVAQFRGGRMHPVPRSYPGPDINRRQTLRAPARCGVWVDEGIRCVKSGPNFQQQGNTQDGPAAGDLQELQKAKTRLWTEDHAEGEEHSEEAVVDGLECRCKEHNSGDPGGSLASVGTKEEQEKDRWPHQAEVLAEARVNQAQGKGAQGADEAAAEARASASELREAQPVAGPGRGHQLHQHCEIPGRWKAEWSQNKSENAADGIHDPEGASLGKVADCRVVRPATVQKLRPKEPASPVMIRHI